MSLNKCSDRLLTFSDCGHCIVTGCKTIQCEVYSTNDPEHLCTVTGHSMRFIGPAIQGECEVISYCIIHQPLCICEPDCCCHTVKQCASQCVCTCKNKPVCHSTVPALQLVFAELTWQLVVGADMCHEVLKLRVLHCSEGPATGNKGNTQQRATELA